MTDQKMIMNEVFDTLLYVTAGVGVSLISKKVFGKSLGAPSDVEGTLKLAVAFAVGTVAVKYAQQKKLIPDDPFK